MAKNSIIDSIQLAENYQHFDVTNKVLLTGHSHQAWPDVSLAGQQQAWLDAAEFVDNKWERAFEKARQLKAFYAKALGDKSAEQYVLAANTHDLIIRFLSALDWQRGKRIITTDGEFHSMRRQLDRLEDAGVDIIRVSVEPKQTLCQRMADLVSDSTIAVMMSAVMYQDAAIMPHLKRVATTTSHQDIPLLVDVYHALNVVPFNLAEQKLENAFIVGGGYKYCQFGEGNCFMRTPQEGFTRPIITGWYAEFSELDEQKLEGQKTRYPKGGDRFQGSTYDPTSHYRAAACIAFFEQQDLNIQILRQKSQYQINLLRSLFDNLDMDPKIISRADVPLNEIAGFLALKVADAQALQIHLCNNNILTDQRGGFLRLGPAPYVSDSQLHDAINCIGEYL